jgi:hypothetical protein
MVESERPEFAIAIGAVQRAVATAIARASARRGRSTCDAWPARKPQPSELSQLGATYSRRCRWILQACRLRRPAHQRGHTSRRWT